MIELRAREIGVQIEHPAVLIKGLVPSSAIRGHNPERKVKFPRFREGAQRDAKIALGLARTSLGDKRKTKNL